MKVSRVDFAFTGRKATFYFTAEARVDFRQLVRDVSQRFGAKVKMVQVGARDEAGLLGGIGVCGRTLCCSTWLKEFRPISIQMAKRQNLSLNPSKISGTVRPAALLPRLRGRELRKGAPADLRAQTGGRGRAVRLRRRGRAGMSNRKLIRPDMGELKKDPAPRSVRRKQTPPEQTNAEEFYYLKQMAARTPMVVVLIDGEELHGWIEWYDKGALKLNRHDGPNLLIPKHNIRYLFKEEELRRGRRKPRPAGSDGGEDSDSIRRRAERRQAGSWSSPRAIRRASGPRFWSGRSLDRRRISPRSLLLEPAALAAAAGDRTPAPTSALRAFEWPLRWVRPREVSAIGRRALSEPTASGRVSWRIDPVPDPSPSRRRRAGALRTRRRRSARSPPSISPPTSPCIARWTRSSPAR